ncbi:MULTISPECIES: hypothetical protein [unclassified Streptomyces]|uniref:hypothetical protein n=1 Tax=unclassified Streptomyces TaxID=2593676 RepID=UPI000CD50932|nr:MULTISPECIES: hypothetical protein [unclassified Streptomyces]
MLSLGQLSCRPLLALAAFLKHAVSLFEAALQLAYLHGVRIVLTAQLLFAVPALRVTLLNKLEQQFVSPLP